MGNMKSLDNIDFGRSDPRNMIKHFEGFAELTQDAYKTAGNITLPPYYIKPKRVVLLGMGGSGAANDMVKSLLDESTDLIVTSVHDYALPRYVDSDTLVIASSYSGNTEETLAGFISAYEKGAKLVAIATGGKLKILAEKYKIPLFLFDYPCPPRGALPYLFILLLMVFVKLGHLEFDDGEFGKMIGILNNHLEKFKTGTSLLGNPAKILAEKLYDKIPIVFATSKLFPVALRYKAEFNENSKSFAFAEEFPELNHKSTEGILHPKDNVVMIMLESNFEFDRNIKRQNITSEIFSKNKVPVERVQFVDAKDRIAEMMLFVMFGEFVSYYLAMLNKENPGLQDKVDYLKERLG